MTTTFAAHGPCEATDLATVEATFAFVDLAGFTALTETYGDAEAVTVVRAFQARVRQAIHAEGELVKTIGDGVMLRFDDPRCAVRLLRRLIAAELSGPDVALVPRVGAHDGSAVLVEGDYYGAAVNLAARVAAEACAGELLVTEEAAFAARDLGAAISHVGTVQLRNIAEPVDIFDVQVDDTHPHAAVDPICRMRAPNDDSGARLHWNGHEIWFCGLPCVAQFAAASRRTGTAYAPVPPSAAGAP